MHTRGRRVKTLNALGLLPFGGGGACHDLHSFEGDTSLQSIGDSTRKFLIIQWVGQTPSMSLTKRSCIDYVHHQTSRDSARDKLMCMPN